MHSEFEERLSPLPLSLPRALFWALVSASKNLNIRMLGLPDPHISVRGNWCPSPKKHTEEVVDED